MLPKSGSNQLNSISQWYHSSFTFICQDSHQGLEFLDQETGDFMAATPKPGMLYMNMSPMFMRLSNRGSNCSIRRTEYNKTADTFILVIILVGHIALSYLDPLALRAILYHILYLQIQMQ